MKILFDRPTVLNMKNLFSPSNLMAAIDHLVESKADDTTYARMTLADRKTWLKAWLCKHHS
jgi:hypothetical protein